MVLRGGYGIFYGTQEYNDIRNALANVFRLPLPKRSTAIASQPNYLTLTNPFPGIAELDE